MKINVSIEVESPEELLRVLQAMARGGVNQAIIGPAANTVSDPEPAKVADGGGDAKKAQGARKTKPDQAASGGPAPSPTTPPPDKSAPATAGGAPTQPEGAAAASTPAPAKDSVPAAAGAAAAVVGLPDNIRSTTSMKDLLHYLREHGVDSVEAMVATCEVLAKGGNTPILKKVPNVAERVKRACEVLSLYPAPDADAAATA